LFDRSAGERVGRARSTRGSRLTGEEVIVKWVRAVHHLESVGQSCAEMAGRPASIFPLRVVGLWAVGDILGPPRDLEVVTVALCVDLPVEDVPWWSEPSGAEHWANATRLAKNPVLPWWRSAHAPVWNHRIRRPVLVWNADEGVRETALAAVADGRGDEVGLAAPSPDEYAARLRDELAVSLAALRGATQWYEDKRWSPGKLEPVADHLWRAADGYLDVLSAVHEGQ
jgi:hypothetical protein